VRRPPEQQGQLRLLRRYLRGQSHVRQQRLRLRRSLYQLLWHLHQSGVRRQQLRHVRDGLRELEHVPERKLHVMTSALPLDDAISRRRAQIAGARHRRRKLAKYVIGVVSASLALCLAAAAKTAFVELRRDSEGSVRPAADRIAPTASAWPAATTLMPPPSETSARQPEPEPASSSSPEKRDPAGAPATRTSPIRDAVRLREASRSALERGSLKSSIEAGESAVALDPSDSEAWLVLGAAYQQMGSLEQARRCFRSCLETGKGGSRGECAAMLR
jgi:tetratricopeptide (TPR) repeat protein